MEFDDECRQEEYNKIAFPKEEEMLSNFLQRCKKKQSEVMMCPQCSAVFDKKATQNLEGVRREKHQGGHKDFQDQQVIYPVRALYPRRYYDPRWSMVKLSEAKRKGPATKPISFKPSAEVSNGKWLLLLLQLVEFFIIPLLIFLLIIEDTRSISECIAHSKIQQSHHRTLFISEGKGKHR